MPILYGLFADGGFVVGDTDTRRAVYAHPDSEQGFEASQAPEEIARHMAETLELQGGHTIDSHSELRGSYPSEQAGFMEWLEAGRKDGSTKELAAQELAPSEIVQRAEARNGCTFDGWEVSPVIEWETFDVVKKEGGTVCEPLAAGPYETVEEAREMPDYVGHFWTVYGHRPQGGVVAIEDFPNEWKAREFLAAVTGNRNADATYPNHSRALPAQGQRDPLADLMRAVDVPDLRQLGEGVGGQVIDWPEQPDTYHGQRDQRAEEGRPIEPAARLLAALRTGWGEQGATVTNCASQERGGLEPGDRVFLAPRSIDRDR